MPVPRLAWQQLPGAVHAAVAARIGGPYTAADTQGGANSGVAALLHPHDGGHEVFVKGLPVDYAHGDYLDTERKVNPYLPGSAPRLRWHIQAGGWRLLGFDAISGRHADLAPGARDLDLIVDALTQTGAVLAPDIALLSAWDRWGYYCTPADEAVLTGRHLLHTDLAATNILIGTDRAHLVDWSWAAVGPPWVDAALWAMRLISDGGHSPEQARHQAMRIPAFAAAPPQAVHLLADAEARRWQDLSDDGVPGIESVTKGSRLWADFWSPTVDRRR
ncbi:aminoglycoside phosphotransferase [Streptomyces melanogenes]|uniref:aminoglycoside phosphotransferase n=1 Tax=Streptomyces melanogenes TaxID=67326 RepID=UPI0037A9B187